MKSVLIVSHGSRSLETKEEVVSLTEKLRQKTSVAIVEYAFLEIESPSIPQGVEQCIRKGATEVIVALNFLNAGKHVNEDIPRIVKECQRKYPHVKISVTSPIGQDEGIVEIFLRMIN
ncbi:MAG: CbiX/SirB N-terminal domain-containing protein [Candidatus Omnitrophica bacterium]|nr:CbiX/SirB N-terminal domain-containing protein [Candidatus Omnitrophota bacterium]